MRLLIIFMILMIASGVAVARLDRPTSGGVISAGVDDLAFTEDDRGFARAINPIPITFPADLGQHPDFRLEWWYYTGNLADAQGNRYGFQLTFFRRGISPGVAARVSEWGSNQIYFAHFALTDVAGGNFYFDERFSRGNPGLAGAQAGPYRVWLDTWQAVETGPGQVRLTATAAEMSLDLTLEQVKPVVLHGNRGLSQKGSTPGNASYYYSFTRNRAAGVITTPRGAVNVTGLAWKDHEWSTSSLGEDTVGWDWFSVQLDDGRDIMVAYLRQADNSAEPVSGGTLIEADGTTRSLSLADISIAVLNTWTSPDSGATYPAEWRLTIPAHGIDVRLTPLLPRQELRLSTVYWEGAVQARGTQQGYGYVELTGYAGSIRGRM